MGSFIKTVVYEAPHLERCPKCYYRDRLTRTCDYYLITGERRGCDPDGCDKWQPRFGGRYKRGGKNNEELLEPR